MYNCDIWSSHSAVAERFRAAGMPCWCQLVVTGAFQQHSSIKTQYELWNWLWPDLSGATKEKLHNCQDGRFLDRGLIRCTHEYDDDVKLLSVKHAATPLSKNNGHPVDRPLSITDSQPLAFGSCLIFHVDRLQLLIYALHELLPSPVRATRPAYFNFLHFVTLACGKKCKLWSSSFSL